MRKKTKFLTIAEAARRLNVPRQTIHAAITQKRLKAKKAKFTVERVVKTVQVGWLIDERDLKAYQPSPQHQEAGKKNN